MQSLGSRVELVFPALRRLSVEIRFDRLLFFSLIKDAHSVFGEKLCYRHSNLVGI